MYVCRYIDTLEIGWLVYILLNVHTRGLCRLKGSIYVSLKDIRSLTIMTMCMYLHVLILNSTVFIFIFDLIQRTFAALDGKICSP